MAGSVVYSSIMAAVLASIRSVRTSLVVFDTSVVDLTELLEDPVEVLFGTQLGGGTDINRALGLLAGPRARAAGHDPRPDHRSVRRWNAEEMLKRAAALVSSGVQLITLLALDDRGAPGFNQQLAGKLAALDVPCFACSPDVFPDLMAAAIERRNIIQWAAERSIVVAR